MLLKHEKIISFSIRWISGRESAYNAGDTGDTGLISESGGSSAGENGSPLQYSRLENSMGRGAWQGYSPKGCKESDMTEHTHTHTHINTRTGAQDGNSTFPHEALQGSGVGLPLPGE